MKLFAPLITFFLFSFGAECQFVEFEKREDLNPDFIPRASCTVDMNGDYLDDIVIMNEFLAAIGYQQLDGSFEYRTIDENFQNWPKWSIVAGDVDNNGFNDLLIGVEGENSLIKANSDGTAYSETILPGYIYSQRSTFADITNDGFLDGFVCNDVDQNHPYLNDGAGNLSLDQSLINTLDMEGNYAAIWVDYNNDRNTDLYISKCLQNSSPGDSARTNLLYKNNGDGTFEEVGEEANMADNSQSWLTIFQDFDNDGDFDAFILNHDQSNLFKLNNGDGTFSDVINSTGIDPFPYYVYDVMSGDFDNNGFVDFTTNLQRYIYFNNGDLTFSKINIDYNVSSVADLNNDGFLDFLANRYPYINKANSNNWIKVNLEGYTSNRNGIGARVEIFGAWGEQIRELRAGEGYQSMNSLNVHFGIAQANEIDSLIVLWPSGNKSKLINPSINTFHLIKEDIVNHVEQIDIENNISVFPNPNSHMLFLNFEMEQQGNLQIEIIGLNGLIIKTYNFENLETGPHQFDLDTSGMANGTYFLKFSNGKSMASKTVIVNN